MQTGSVFFPAKIAFRLQVTSDIADLEAAFDPSKPLTFTFEYDVVPPLVWKRSYKDLEVTIK